jgi:heme-binding NEAT domain protein
MKAARVIRYDEPLNPPQNSSRTPPQIPHYIPPQPRRQRLQSKPKTNLHKTLAVESLTKIGINLCLAGVAIVTLLQQFPQQKQQEVKLREINTEVNKVQARVNLLQDNLSRYFDPTTSSEVMQEQTHLVLPNHREIVIKEAPPK